MSYKVIKDFADLQDNEYVYHAGDIFPRMGHEVTEVRILELASVFNKREEVLIEEVKPEVSEKAKSLPQKDKEEPQDEIVEKPKKKAKKGNSKE